MDKAAYDKGLATRTAVLGKDYVNNAMNNADAFNQPMQDLLNEYCWGTVWSREGLPRKTRSLINVALLTAFRAGTELKSHIRGARNNGCTKAEIREVLLQTGVYAGIPVMREAVRAAQEVFAEERKRGK